MPLSTTYEIEFISEQILPNPWPRNVCKNCLNTGAYIFSPYVIALMHFAGCVPFQHHWLREGWVIGSMHAWVLAKNQISCSTSQYVFQLSGIIFIFDVGMCENEWLWPILYSSHIRHILFVPHQTYISFYISPYFSWSI